MEHELTGCYPIILDGAETGKVTVSREGLFWRFDAKCAMREGLLRLSVYGEGAEGYLGVMEPLDGSLRLSKKMSRNALSGFPAAISYATCAGETPPKLVSCEAAPEEAPAECEDGGGECGGEEEAADCGEPPPEDDRPPPAFGDFSMPAGWRHCPMPCSLFSDIAAKSVCSGISGALLRETQDGIILAVPEPSALELPENRILIFSETEIFFGRRYRLATVKYK